ncbi:MAG: aminotransferase class V-fold PLP-dependent enzyme, partial [Flavobacteriales bacterium]
LLVYATEKLISSCPARVIGTAPEKAAILSFVVPGVNALDLGMYLDTQGIAVRTGQHCTEPVMDRFGIPGTIRASFMFYNTLEEIDRFIEAVVKGINLLKH